jgi:hypothetical protein
VVLEFHITDIIAMIDRGRDASATVRQKLQIASGGRSLSFCVHRTHKGSEWGAESVLHVDVGLMHSFQNFVMHLFGKWLEKMHLFGKLLEKMHPPSPPIEESVEFVHKLYRCDIQSLSATQ